MYKFQNLKPIEGDASFRKFFRNKIKNKSSIVVFAKKEKFKNPIKLDPPSPIYIFAGGKLNKMNARIENKRTKLTSAR